MYGGTDTYDSADGGSPGVVSGHLDSGGGGGGGEMAGAGLLGKHCIRASMREGGQVSAGRRWLSAVTFVS
jgi:hypothetical protein